jgi:hypothetical protein
MNDFSFFNAFKSLISVILINTIIIYSRINKKKIIFFYHPRKLAVGIHTFYVEDLLEEFRESSVIIYGYNDIKNLGKNYFFIKSSYLKLLLGVDIFMSANMSDVVVANSKKVFLNHHIYDSPLINFEKEKVLCRRFSKYDIVFLPSQDLIKLFNEMFARYSSFADIKKPTLIEIGYPKFDFLEKKINNIKSLRNCILISPTNIYFYSDPKFSLLNELDKLITELIDNTEFNIIFRPHPLNRRDPKILKIKNKFNNSSKFIYDASEDYSLTFSKSICFITDQSDTAYMFAFLTKHPVVFYSNKNLEYLINSEESEIKKYGYCNLKYFKNREKVGAIISQAEFASEKINKIKNNLKKYELSISELIKEIRYLGKSKKKFIEEINKLLFNN